LILKRLFSKCTARFFVFLKCTTQGEPKLDVLMIAFLQLWLKFWDGIDKYWVVPVRQLFYFHCCCDRKAVDDEMDADLGHLT